MAENKDETTFVPRAGSIRFTDKEGLVHRASPGDYLYSTVMMYATEYWCVEEQQWKRMDTE